MRAHLQAGTGAAARPSAKGDMRGLLLLIVLQQAAGLSTRLSHVLTLAERPFNGDDERPSGLVADVCCDHGYLAAELAARGRSVVACDVAEEPLANCRRHFAWRSVEPVKFVLGDGVAAVMADAELPWCETAVIAGVGARTAARLIDAACDVDLDLPPPRRFVVQPTQQFIAHAHDLRSTLHARGYDVVEERWLDDNGERLKRTGRRVLVTIRAERRATGTRPSETEMLVGKSTRDTARAAYVAHHRDWLAAIVRDLPEHAVARQRAEGWLALLETEADPDVA